MTARIQTNRFTTTGSRPPSTRPVGELAINFADNQISVTDPTPAARDILPIRFHSATAVYLANDIVRQGTALYQAKANTPAHAFNATEWNQFLTNAQGDARWLPLAGGTLTGPLTLSGPPTVNLHAATKLYVDTADLTKVPLAGGTMTGLLTLSAAPTSNLHAATKLYVDGQVGLYLPLAGGTLTGNLTVRDTVFFSSSGMSLFAGPTSSIWTMDNSNYDLIYNRSTGDLAYRRGGDGVELWGVHENGDSTVAGSFTASGNITTASNIAAAGSIAANGLVESATDVYARGGHYYFGADDGRVLSTDTGGTALQFWSDGWSLSWSRVNGSLAFFSNTSLPLFTVDANGNGLFHGTVHGTNVTLLEEQINLLQARIAALEGASP